MFNNNNFEGFANSNNNFEGLANNNNNNGGNNMNFNNNKGYAPRQTITSGPTQKQINLYIRLSNEKGQAIDPQHNTWSVVQMSQAIQGLMNMKTVNTQQQGGMKDPNTIPATQKQIATIMSVSAELGLVPEQAFIQQLTLAKASETVKQLFAMRDSKIDAKATINQLNLLRDMYKCPDIPLEAFCELFDIKPELIELKQKLQNRLKVVLRSQNTDSERVSIGNQIVQVKNSIYKNIEESDWSQLGRNKVSEFIQKYQNAFYTFKDNQITPGQIYKIQSLQQQLANFNNHWNIDLSRLASDINGNDITEVSDVLQDFSTKEDFNIDESGLQLMTKNIAHDYITQLQKEVARKSNDSSSYLPEDTNQTERLPKTAFEANEEEQKKLVDMIFGLYAMLGQEAETETINSKNLGEKIAELINFNAQFNPVERIIHFLESYFDIPTLMEILGNESTKIEWLFS